MRETMKSRAKRGDNVVTNVDVRQGVLAKLVFDGRNLNVNGVEDGDIAGSTDYAFVVVGVASVALDFELEFYFNGGKIGATVAQTVAAGTAGVATPTAVSGISDNQLAYATSVVCTLTTPINTVEQFEVYLVKKVVLG